jgi:cellulose synthase/poly-beta-1,6-N-acetylglucosamine synthase-like glycosyltransferase
VAPAGTPRDLNAFKSQQFRWAKGSTRTAIKLMLRIWRSSFKPF